MPAIPAGYVLVERELLGLVVKRLWAQAERDRVAMLLPACISAPSPGYLAAVERGA